MSKKPFDLNVMANQQKVIKTSKAVGLVAAESCLLYTSDAADE